MNDHAGRKQLFGSYAQILRSLPDEEAAIEYFAGVRWKHGPFCPRCGSIKIYHYSDQRIHRCGDCRVRFSIKSGTIFEGSKVALRDWMIALWLATSLEKGISSIQLAKEIGVTQKTAWLMLRRLRSAARTPSFNQPLSGE